MNLILIDWVIIGVYFTVVLLVGLIFTRRAGKNLNEYFLSGRNLPWWIVGTSMVATTFSADTPTLVTNIVRTNGVSGNWVWWAFLITGMVTVFLYAKLWRRSEALTDIGFYELRYSGKPAAFLRGFRAIYLGILFNIIVMGIVTLAAIKIGNALLGINKYYTILICGAITVFYSCTAGLWGVVVTDLLLFVMAMAGSVAAAYYAINHPAVGGFTGFLTNGSIAGKVQFLPDFTQWETVVPLFIIPIAVQWWSVWYPGAEPGGGGYIAQRMLASKNEKHSLLATLWFNVAHYAIRPWPWIIVALCSLIVFPTLSDIKAQFPGMDETLINHDMAYPAMLAYMPSGWLGLIVASLAAAYMSTISTQLNWGASYVVDDFYKRFISREATDRHYVFVARLVTVFLMIVSSLFALQLGSALEGFNILLQIGAGTGLIFLLRWFWWRINAWSEISAMLVSFLIAIYFQFYHIAAYAYIFPEGTDFASLTPIQQFLHQIGYIEKFADWQKLVIGVLITTPCWLLVTFITPKTKTDVLQNFYDKIQPLGKGWSKVVDTSKKESAEDITPAILAIFLGCSGVYCSLFSTGFFLYNKIEPAVMLGVIAFLSFVGIMRLLPRMNWRI